LCEKAITWHIAAEIEHFLYRRGIVSITAVIGSAGCADLGLGLVLDASVEEGIADPVVGIAVTAALDDAGAVFARVII
jgi:hypothetical protein